MKIFLSHSSRDRALVREIRDYLPKHIKTWLDEDDLLVADDLKVSIKSAIEEEADFVVIFLAREAIKSDWVKQELEWALEREKKIGRTFVLPVLVEDIWDEVEPEEFRRRKYLKCLDQSKEGVRNCAQTLSNHIFAWLSRYLDESKRTRLKNPDIKISLFYGHIKSFEELGLGSGDSEKALLLKLGGDDEDGKKNDVRLGRPGIKVKVINVGAADVEIEEVNLRFKEAKVAFGNMSEVAAVMLNSLSYQDMPQVGRFLLKSNHAKEFELHAKIFFEQIISRGIEGVEVIDVAGRKYEAPKEEVDAANSYFQRYFEIDGFDSLYMNR
jgi:hypothetical protein